jgi:hypothetical protein
LIDWLIVCLFIWLIDCLFVCLFVVFFHNDVILLSFQKTPREDGGLNGTWRVQVQQR